MTWGLIALAVVLLATQEGPRAYVVLAIVLGAAAFGVRGYSLADGELLVHRLGWATRLDLSRLVDVRAEPGITAGALRTFGNGGLFGLTGHFRSEELGAYVAYVTDPMRAVVLEFRGRRVVVSPDDPEHFVEAVRVEADLEESPTV